MAVGSCLMDPPLTEPAPVPSPAPARPRLSRVGRFMWRVARIPLLIYLVVAAVLFSLQTRIIFPGAERQGQPSTKLTGRPGSELLSLTTERGEKIVALFGPALLADGQPDPAAASRATLIYFYGNAMCLADCDEEFARFRSLGLNVLIPEFVGYGMSEGKAGEAGCYRAADTAYEYLRSRKDLDPTLIIAGGWSLGGAVALDLASRKPVAGLIMFSSFTSMIDMARRNFPFLPASLLLRHRFDSLRKIPRVTCPILIGHGRRDDLIPFEMSDRLAAAAKSPVMRLAIDGAGHNDFYAVGGEKVFEAVRTFVSQLTPIP